MKVIILFILSAVTIVAQPVQHKSLIELKNNVRIINNQKNELFPEITYKKKSIGLAILYSFLLPGMGELYADSYGSGKYFTIADAVFWSTFAGFNIYGNWEENNYKSFAESSGGISLTGKNDKYFANIGIYRNINEYNNAMRLNREFNKVYDTKTHYWHWASSAQKKEYRNMWTSSQNAYNNIRFAVGALILNRIASVINAVRLVVAYNKHLKKGISWNVSFGIINNPTLPTGFRINYITTF